VSDHSIHVDRAAGHVTVVTLERPPANFFSLEMIGELADTLEAIGADGTTRAVVIRAAGKHFCAGADFTVLDADGERQLIDVGSSTGTLSVSLRSPFRWLPVCTEL